MCSGVALYFMLLKSLGAVFLIMACLSIPNLLINLFANRGRIAVAGGVSALAATTMGKFQFVATVNVSPSLTIPPQQLVPWYSMIDIIVIVVRGVRAPA
jgi:hypothetical protein